jgi:hypothetical protein
MGCENRTTTAPGRAVCKDLSTILPLKVWVKFWLGWALPKRHGKARRKKNTFFIVLKIKLL